MGKEQNVKKVQAGVSVGVVILTLLLVFLWFSYEDKVSSYEDYKMCAEECVSDAQDCLTPFLYPLTLNDVETCSDDLSSCVEDCDMG